MAERRMFAKTIIDSDAFVDMPLTTQALYFHLAMRADDEGFINNHNKICRMISANKNDMDMLIVKRFIIPFDSGVCVVKHWRIHNYIQSDRFKETFYQEEKQMLGLKENKAYTLKNPLCIQTVSNLETQDRLGKESLELDKVIDIDTSEVSTSASVPYKQIMQYFNSICQKASKIRGIEGPRKKAVAARWKANNDIEIFITLFKKTEESKFLNGDNDRNWQVDFDWLMKPQNMTKVLEGRYDNKTATQTYKPRGKQEIVPEWMQDNHVATVTEKSDKELEDFEALISRNLRGGK